MSLICTLPLVLFPLLSVAEWALDDVMLQFFCLDVLAGQLQPLLKLQLLLSLVSGGENKQEDEQHNRFEG